MKLLRRALLLLAVILLLPVSAQAAGKNTITVLHSRDGVVDPGVVFELYRVDASHTDPLKAYATALQAGNKPVATASTDDRGKATFSGLADGTYLLTGKPYAAGDFVCELEMSLLRIPGETGDAVVVIPKYATRPNTDQTLYRVIILWEDQNASQWRPASVSVQLFRNGEKHSVIRPDKDGNWQYSWTESDPLAVWAVLETVPEHYTASYSRDGNTFVILNTLKVASTPDKGDKLPQTGQLWWPVPFLALTGSFLFLTGWFLRKESENEA